MTAPRNYTDMIRIINEFCEVEPDFEILPLADVREFIKKSRCEINLPSLSSSIEAKVAKSISSEKLTKARELRTLMLDNLKASKIAIARSVLDSREKIIEQIKNFEKSSPQYAAYFRNLERIGDDELYSIYVDLVNMSIIEKQNKKNDT